MARQRIPNSRFSPIDIKRQQSLEDLPLASFRKRSIAFAIDFCIVTLFLGILNLPVTVKTMNMTNEFKMDIDPFHGWELLSLPLYFGLWTYFGNGQTIGKKLTGIRVISIAHERLTFWHSIERSLGYGASILEGGFGFLQYFIHPNRQTVHDRIAETIVISIERKRRI
jgi:uncharacterized RDD family membrane protein YckC